MKATLNLDFEPWETPYEVEIAGTHDGVPLRHLGPATIAALADEWRKTLFEELELVDPAADLPTATEPRGEVTPLEFAAAVEQAFVIGRRSMCGESQRAVDIAAGAYATKISKQFFV